MLDKKFLLVICFGIFLVSLVSATVTIIQPIANGNYSTTLNINVSTDGSGADATNATNVTCWYDSAGAENRDNVLIDMSVFELDGTTNYFNGSVDIGSFTETSIYNISCTAFNSSDDVLHTSSVANITIDNTYPVPSIAVPANATNTTDTGLDVNYTYTETNPYNCWWSNDTGVSNYSLTSCGNNITNVTWREGVTTVFVYMNDTAGNVNSTQVTFTIDVTYPLISMVSPANDTNNSANTLDVTFTYTEINLGSCWYSNDTMDTNTTLTNCANITDVIWIDGNHNVTIWINDSANNVNSTSATFNIDTTYPQLAYGEGTQVNNTNQSYNSVYVNVSLTEINNDTIAFRLFYSNGSAANATLFTSGAASTKYINWTTLPDGVYTYNVTVNDSAGNTNTTDTYTITVDTTYPQLDYGEGTQVNNTNQSYNSVYVNVSLTEINNDTIAFRLFYSNGSAANATLFTSGAASTKYINWTTLPDGVYTYNVTVNDSAGNTNTTDTYTITVDTTYPQLDYGAVTLANDTTTNLYNWTYVNISLTEIHNDTITFVLYNSTSLVNTTLFTGGAASTKYINWTGLMDDTYTYYVTVNDSAGNSNTTANRTIMLDHVSPVPTITSSSATQTSLTLTITADGGVSGTNTSCWLELRVDSASISGTNATQTLTESSLVCATSYTYQVSCNDRAGNAGTSIATSFSTSACDSSGGGSSSSSGGASYTWRNTYSLNGEQFKAGYTKELKVQNRIKVKVGSSYHHVGVKELTTDSATIEIASDPVEVILNIGEDAKVDVDNDNIYDIYVKLLGIASNQANVFVQEISEKIPEEKQEEKIETTGEVVIDEDSGVEISESGKKDDLTWLWVLIVVLILAAVIGGGVAVKKRKSIKKRK